MLIFRAEGTCPDVMVCCPPEWTAEQIALWQGTFDAMYSGNLKLKSKMRFIPGGGKPFEMKGSAGDLLKSEYDEWMARIVCRAFRTDPKPYIKELKPCVKSEQLQEQMRAQGLNGEMLWWSSLMEQQRVAIARALINAPSLLLADEPTGNLDTRTSHEIMETLRSLNRERGVTIVLVTHEADIAAYADRVVTMRDGKIVADERVSKPAASAARPSRSAQRSSTRPNCRPQRFQPAASSPSRS